MYGPFYCPYLGANLSDLIFWSQNFIELRIDLHFTVHFYELH